MKTIKDVTVFKCDFCEKKLFRKHAMVNHEKKCSQNPLNIRACFDCSMCEKVVIKYEPEPQTYEDEELIKSTCFMCLSKNIFMYPPKIEHSERGLPSYVLRQGAEIIQEKMPLKCDVKKRIQDDMESFFKTLGN